MAHYALLDENNVVIEVITGVDENEIQIDIDGTEVGGSSESWEEFYATRPWLNATLCKRTSYNGNIRKNYAGIGYVYDPVRDAFIPPKQFESWILNEETCLWQAPVPYPTLEEGSDEVYIWDENSISWLLLPPSN